MNVFRSGVWGISIVFFLALGVAVGLGLTGKFSEKLWGKFPALSAFFTSNDNVLYSKTADSFDRKAYPDVNWDALLPETERGLLGNGAQGQNDETSTPLHEQIFNSIQRTFDDDYQRALVSTNIVAALDQKPVTLNGFIVPVEANAERRITAFFVVPYFGACIHYPPPPPNQIVYISLKPDSDGEAGLSHDSVGIGNIDIQKAYSFSGVLHVGMYEDVQGTSAYIMDVVEIAEYVGSAQEGAFHKESTFTKPVR
ncbi:MULTISPECIES: DUF3299 domain-containing protein [unclassified Alteromonas]|uniref:DUF3299 domain-containing protein n=1 Tax=unclassified Alteromonas TaxID=2614992 RepID=UPI0019217E58|nr:MULTISPECIES: DUF3299 domain-containing protein [unclassified Alteromonas]